nr:TlpA disulfide reductase family protein [uncultured Actinoplanes sp.]
MLLLLVTVTAACGSDDQQTRPPFADCAALTTPPSTAAKPAAAAAVPQAAGAPRLAGFAAPAASSDGPSGRTPQVSDIPDLRLPCFTDGKQVALRDIQGPAVINLWASWCRPCRAELPVMQQLADRSAGKLHVLGIDTGDSREAGASFATAKGVRFPTLFDEDRKALNALTGTTLPITLFVDATGTAYVHRLPLDARTLTEQVKEHTGVTVTL